MNYRATEKDINEMEKTINKLEKESCKIMEKSVDFRFNIEEDKQIKDGYLSKLILKKKLSDRVWRIQETINNMTYTLR